MQLMIRADETIMLPVYTDFEICPMTTVTTLKVTAGPWTGATLAVFVAALRMPEMSRGGM
jgi:hypothetical protein